MSTELHFPICLRNYIPIPALPFSRLQRNIRKPFGNKYIQMPNSLGEKIRNKRLELGLYQKDIAAIMEVSEDTITYWENNRSKPLTKQYSKIVKFLGIPSA